jgi:hypothetical protein
MISNTWQFRIRASFAVASVVVLLGAATNAFAQEHGNPIAQDAPAGTKAEGIKVHGHWILDIKNADGTLASHHEFENALVPTGADLLTRLLAGSDQITEFLVEAFFTYPPDQQPPISLLSPVSLSVPSSGPFAHLLVIQSGLIMAGNPNASLTRVGTRCVVASDGSFVPLTARDLPTAIPLLADQLIQVTVVLSFS